MVFFRKCIMVQECEIDIYFTGTYLIVSDKLLNLSMLQCLT